MMIALIFLKENHKVGLCFLGIKRYCYVEQLMMLNAALGITYHVDVIFMPSRANFYDFSVTVC